MKKLIFRIAVLTATFFIGAGIFIFVFLPLNPIPEIAAPEFLPASAKYEKYDRLETGFPGISRKISEIRKGKGGYFPKDDFSGRYDKRADFMEWYGENLRAMGEKSLLNASNGNAEIYRFLWLRAFSHPIFVRIERKQDEIILYTKELDGTGSSEPGKVLRSNKIFLKQDEFRKFLSLLEKSNYWNLPLDIDDPGRDGAQWVLEGVKGGRYHVVDRWNPKNGEYREACLYLLNLSGVDLDRLKDDLY